MSNKNGKDTTDQVVQAVEESALNDHLIRLSSGVVLRAKQAPPLILVKVMARFQRPKPPLWKNPNMGREMENPEDPEYIEQLKAYQTQMSNALLDALILLGTELVETPRGFSRPEKNDWLEEFDAMGLETKPGSKSWRYLNWVMFKAVKNEDDLSAISSEVGRLSGVSEDAVKSAETFSGRDPNDQV